jgi:cytosine deaminase
MDGIHKLGLSTALAKARKSYQEGGIPIGAALVYHGSSTDPKDAVVLGCSHNSRIQKSSATLHGEIAALEDAGRLKAQVYRGSTMVRFAMSPGSIVSDIWCLVINKVYDLKVGVIVIRR